MQIIFIVLLALFCKYQIDPDEDLIRSYACKFSYGTM